MKLCNFGFLAVVEDEVCLKRSLIAECFGILRTEEYWRWTSY